MGITGVAVFPDALAHIPPNYTTFVPPALGQSYNDQTYGYRITRVTDAVAWGLSGGAGHFYSVPVAWNADNTRMVVCDQVSGSAAIVNRSGSFVRTFGQSGISCSANNFLFWDNVNPNVLYDAPANRIERLTLGPTAAQDTRTVLYTFNGADGGRSCIEIDFGNGESDVSLDNRYLVALCDDRFIRRFDLQTNTASTWEIDPGLGLDWADLDGNNNILTSAGSVINIRLWNGNTGAFMHNVTIWINHHDEGRDASGNPVIFITGSGEPTGGPPGCTNGIQMYRTDLPYGSPGQFTCLIGPVDWTLDAHMSYANGWLHVNFNSYANCEELPPATLPATWQTCWTNHGPYVNELVLIKVPASGTPLSQIDVHRLAHYRSRKFEDYYYTPRASISKDARFVLFDSNYRLDPPTTGTSYTDGYIIDLSSITAPSADTTPSVRSNGMPTGTLSAGTTQTNINLTTNEAATCKYSTTPGTLYTSMPNTFTTTGGTFHNSLVTGLVNGNTYNYYVRCNDTAGNFNTNDFNIAFSVASLADTTLPSVSITTPANGSIVSGTLTVNVTATDNVAVAYVELYKDNVFSANDTTSPYQYLWNTQADANGLYTLRARAVDTSNNANNSVNVTINVNNLAPDTTPPVISSVQASLITSSGATITWTTNEPSDSQVDYGLTTSYGSQTSLDGTLVTSHVIVLSNLNPSTLYHYRVKSRDVSNNLNTSSDFTFTTSSPPSQDLSVSLIALPQSGTWPLTTSLTADVSGSASGNINYTFYCNRQDTGTNIISPYSLRFNNTAEDPKVVSNACTYNTAGNYYVKVIVERGIAPAAQAQAIIAVSDPIVVTSGSGGGGGGGGRIRSATETSSPPEETNLLKLTPGAATIITDFNPEVGIEQIRIEVNSEAQGVRVTISKHDEKSEVIPVSKSGKVYQYLQIDEENIGNKLDKAVVQFKVEKSWASDNHLEKDNIAVYKLDESSSQWNELITTLTEEDDAYYYYDIELDSLSYFAIAGRIVIVAEEKGKFAEGIKEFANKIIGAIKPYSLWILIGVGVLVVVIIVIILRKRIKGKKEYLEGM